MTFEDNVKKHLYSGDWALIEKFDDGTGGSNEVAYIRLGDGTRIVHKVMLALEQYFHIPGEKLPPGKMEGRQKRKAITEITFALLDKGIGGDLVAPNVYVQLWKPFDSYHAYWGADNVEGVRRLCEVVRQYAPKWSGEEWRGELYKNHPSSLPYVDSVIRHTMSTSPDAQRIALLDMLTINQDRSARNWATNGKRFYAIDNGMAWFHEYPDSDDWKQGCVVDDVLIQVGPWRFIAGVFSTLWAGEPLSTELLEGLRGFHRRLFLSQIGEAAIRLGFPETLSSDWRFFAILCRMSWMIKHKRLPTKTEYRDWLKGSKYMTPPEVVEAGGNIVWLPGWDVGDYG